MLKIDSKIAPPPIRKPYEDRSERLQTILALKVGESFFLPETKIGSTSTIKWCAVARHPERSFTAKSIDGGVRIWRVK